MENGFKQINNFILYKEIGKGAVGKVYLAKDKETNKVIAVKVIPQKYFKNEKSLKSFQKTIKLIHKLNHKNLTKLVGFEKTKHNFYVALEYSNGLNLYDYLQNYMKQNNNNPLEESIVKKIIIQVAKGIKHLHNQNIIHRDIKLENILINYDDQEYEKKLENLTDLNEVSPLILSLDSNNFTIKIADFGFSRELNENNVASTICGTPISMAPDIIQCDENHKYNNSVDFWSLGTVMYELLIGKPPFYNKNYKKLFSEILNGIYSYPKNINISIESISFINGLLQFDPKKRFNWNDIKEHPFIKNNYENFHKLNLHLNIPESDEKLKLIELDSKNYDNFIWIVFQDNNQVGVRLDQINKNIIQNNIKEEYIEKTKDKIDTNKNNNIINNNNNAYDKYSFIDLEKRKKEEAFINDFEELELPDNSFEVVKGYNQYENEKWEIISTESQNLD